MAAPPRKSYAANVRVPCAVVERALLRDMIYAACPRCQTSLNAALQRVALGCEDVVCASCGTSVKMDAVAYKYRLKLTLLIDMDVRDAMLFDEVAQSLMGTPAATLRKLLAQYPSLPSLLEELLLGLRVSFSYQPAQNRQNADNKYQRDLKVLSIQPLVPALLPKPLVSLAMAHLTREYAKRPRADDQ